MSLVALLSAPASADLVSTELQLVDGRVTLLAARRADIVAAGRAWLAAGPNLPCQPRTRGLEGVVFWLDRSRATARAAEWLALASYLSERGVPLWLYVGPMTTARTGFVATTSASEAATAVPVPSAIRLADAARARALADYAAALRTDGQPIVAGRPTWPRFDTAEQHFLAASASDLSSAREPFPDSDDLANCTPLRSRQR